MFHHSSGIGGLRAFNNRSSSRACASLRSTPGTVAKVKALASGAIPVKDLSRKIVAMAATRKPTTKPKPLAVSGSIARLSTASAKPTSALVAPKVGPKVAAVVQQKRKVAAVVGPTAAPLAKHAAVVTPKTASAVVVAQKAAKKRPANVAIQGVTIVEPTPAKRQKVETANSDRNTGHIFTHF